MFKNILPKAVKKFLRALCDLMTLLGQFAAKVVWCMSQISAFIVFSE